MNLPVGGIVEQGTPLDKFEFKGKIEGLFDKGFSGYVIASIEGFDGIEEGALLFKKGALVGALYEYSNYDITVFGDIALPQIFNSFAAKYGIAEIYSLSNQQVDLVTAFNDRVKLSRALGKKDISKFYVKEFSTSHAEKVLSKVLEEHESRESVLKKLGLSGLG